MDLKKQAAEAARSFISTNTSVGLGDGSCVGWLARMLIDDIKQGLQIQLTTSSPRTKQLLLDAEIPISDLLAIKWLDQYFDGCDQIDSSLNLIKSGAGIHTMEKLFAASANEFMVMADSTKWVNKLDTTYPIVIEYIPVAQNVVFNEMRKIFPGAALKNRTEGDENNPVLTANGNRLAECRFTKLPDPEDLYTQCKNITGVVELSLFYQMADQAIIAGPRETRIYVRKENRISENNLTTQFKNHDEKQL